MKGITRRDVLEGGAAAGMLLVARPFDALAASYAAPLGAVDHFGTSRLSRLFPDSGRFVVHADLHNHTLLSDGVAEAADAFPMMRAAGLDVAALTDHAVMGQYHGVATCNKGVDPSDPRTGRGMCSQYLGINDEGWRRLRELADSHDAPGEYVAMRGFEWTTPQLGHINVWFSEGWTDAFTTGSLQSVSGAGELMRGQPTPFGEIGEVLLSLPNTATIDGFYDWLAADPSRPVVGGGADALAGFNHPNQFGNFNDFQFFGEVVDRLVSCEVHNGPTVEGDVARDYWFWGVAEGQPWPVNACLNAGWRVGLIGVSDNHTDTFGRLDAARGGLWVRDLTRDGVREALAARRMYSTTVPGLRFDASANGVPMGGTLTHDRGPITFSVDLDRGPDWHGRPVVVEIARPGETAPVLLDAVEVRLPAPSEPVITFTRDLDRADGDWVVLRITDPDEPLDDTAVQGPWAEHGGAIAYASPFFLAEGRPAAPPPPDQGAAAAPPARALPATGGAVAAGAGLLAGAVLVDRLRR